MKVPKRNLEDIILAMLSVNNYRLTDAWALLPGLRAAGLCDAQRVARMTDSEVATNLKEAGYDRGKITEIVAPRLRALMSIASTGALDELAAAVEAKDLDRARSLLLPIPGVGPRVLETAWLLLTSDGKS